MSCLEETIHCHVGNAGLLWKRILMHPGRWLLLFVFLSHIFLLHLPMPGPGLDAEVVRKEDKIPVR